MVEDLLTKEMSLTTTQYSGQNLIVPAARIHELNSVIETGCWHALRASTSNIDIRQRLALPG